MQITLNLDTTGYKDKASVKKAVGAICNRTKNAKRVVCITPGQLITEIEKGVTFTPGEMSGTLESDWKSQQIIAADIDNDKSLLGKDGKPVKENNKAVKVPCNHIITPNEALKVLHANNLDPSFMYYSFSNKEELPKFRIVFVLSEKLTDGAEAKKLTRKLAYLFNSMTGEPNADMSIQNLDRLLFGSAPGSVFYNSGQVTDKNKFNRLVDPGEDKPKQSEKPKDQEAAKAEERANLDRDVERFDLLDYIQRTRPGSKVHRIGRQTYINPCPVCGHNDDFRVKDNKAFWACYGGSTAEDTNGSIIDYLVEVEHKTLPDALDYFKHEIMHYPRIEFNGSAPTNGGQDPKEGKAKESAAPLPDLMPISADELLKKEIPELRYVIDGILPEGFGLLAAPPKSYKSFMCLEICAAVCQGLPVLGRNTTKTKCLYFDLESGNRRPQQRLKSMGMIENNPAAAKDLMFVTKDELKAYQKGRGLNTPLTLSNGFADVLEAYLLKNPEVGLVIVDVFGKIRTEQKKTQQLYEHDYADIDRLQSIATRRNVCIMAVHHTTKLKDDTNVFNNMSGSTGLFGASDFAWIIDKQRFNDSEATLHTAGRDIEQNELAISWNKSRLIWEYKGTAEEVQKAKEREDYEQNAVIQAIKKLVSTNGDKWQGTVSDIIKASKYFSMAIYDKPQAVGKIIDKSAPLLLKYDNIKAGSDRDNTKERARIRTFCKADKTLDWDDEIELDY